MFIRIFQKGILKCFKIKCTLHIKYCIIYFKVSNYPTIYYSEFLQNIGYMLLYQTNYHRLEEVM